MTHWDESSNDPDAITMLWRAIQDCWRLSTFIEKATVALGILALVALWLITTQG